MTQFTIMVDRTLEPNPGHEAAWSFFETKVMNQYGNIGDLMKHYSPRCRGEGNCKIVLLVFSYASEDQQWSVLQEYPDTFRDLINYSPVDWRIERAFLPEMLTFLRIMQ